MGSTGPTGCTGWTGWTGSNGPTSCVVPYDHFFTPSDPLFVLWSQGTTDLVADHGLGVDFNRMFTLYYEFNGTMFVSSNNLVHSDVSFSLVDDGGFASFYNTQNLDSPSLAQIQGLPPQTSPTYSLPFSLTTSAGGTGVILLMANNTLFTPLMTFKDNPGNSHQYTSSVLGMNVHADIKTEYDG
ncbi:MAG: hypothetical protein WB421_17980, partial [Terriglobales bacterium]